MQIPPPQEKDHTHALPNEGRGQTSRQFKGIRLREWGKWVSEIRVPKSRDKIYLGSYKTAEQAARAFDAAMYCLRGPNAKFNFPDSLPVIPSAVYLSRRQIQVAAADYALNKLPWTSPSLHNNIDNNTKEEASHPSQSSSTSDMELSSEDPQKTEESTFWKSLFAEPDGAQYLNLEKIPSIDEALALELIPTWQEEVGISEEPIGLWNFEEN